MTRLGTIASVYIWKTQEGREEDAYILLWNGFWSSGIDWMMTRLCSGNKALSDSVHSMSISKMPIARR